MTVGRRKKRRIDSYLLAMTNKVADNVLDFDRATALEIPEHRGCQRRSLGSKLLVGLLKEVLRRRRTYSADNLNDLID
jgi:hypothetical protein